MLYYVSTSLVNHSSQSTLRAAVPPWFPQTMKASLDDFGTQVEKAVTHIKEARRVSEAEIKASVKDAVDAAVDELKKSVEGALKEAVDRFTRAAEATSKQTIAEINTATDVMVQCTVGNLEQIVGNLEQTVRQTHNSLEAKINALSRLAARSYNAACADGALNPFVVVPFPDGTLPSNNPNTPTVITSIHVIESLSAAELDQYYSCYAITGDGEGARPDLVGQQDAVRVAVGCTRKIS
ncbi:hypothetical protein K438DRAFT_1930632 [Mycena galopus ATCC 62051]|nr:hypothetical protein K438DRAFT_1930632 [Mycena galopus ATCC 62051]